MLFVDTHLNHRFKAPSTYGTNGQRRLSHYCMSEQNNKLLIRRSIRKKRRALTQSQQFYASKALARNARKYRQLLFGQKILSYSPIGGEINPEFILSLLQAKVYLPRITHYQSGSMRFYQGEQDFNTPSYGKVRLGINEPSSKGSSLSAQHLDAVLMPLVAFDRNGNRLGMGGGFYDRCFSFKLRKNNFKRPLMVGLAHRFQETETVFADPWDVPLDAIITDRELIVI